MKNRYWMIILAITVAICLSFPVMAGKIDDARKKWPGLSWIADRVKEMIQTACPIMDEDETITGNWTFSGNNTHTGTQAISSSSVAITATSISLAGDDWQDSEVADDLTLSGATVTAATLSGTLTGASGGTANFQDPNFTLILPVTTTHPSNPVTGTVHISGNSIFFYNGSAWKEVAGS